MSTGYGRPWTHVGRRVPHNPVVIEGDQYCLHCKEWESAETEGRYEGTCFATKQWCKQCGTVISYSVVRGQGTPDQVRRATDWATSREHITRELRSVIHGKVR